MLESLSAFLAEIREIEDEWFEKAYEDLKCVRKMRSISLWTSDWNLLREIEDRHGIYPGDPRVHSIASYKCELGAIRKEWERDCLERVKFIRANPGFDPPYDRRFLQHLNREANCEARTFPVLDLTDLEPRVDNRPKAWQLRHHIL